MLAVLGEPFDSEEHLFEVKWDGFRALATIDGDGLRLRSRRRLDMTRRFADLSCLARAGEGVALDGEVVGFTDGRPDFERLLERDAGPVAFIAFDLLYDRWTSLLARPLHERRARLAAVVQRIDDPRVQLSDGVVGAGKAFFAAITARGFEGVVGKRLDSVYEAGQRTGAWTKAKRVQMVHCVVLGYLAEAGDLRSLLLGAQDEATGALRYVGRCGSGLDATTRRAMLPCLRARHRAAPLVACSERAQWVEPGVYCVVKFVERTRSGHLRAPVFVDWSLA
ncbi:MAG TPA: hypothetical protein VK081_03355 [Planctomycetota bacterium]|nr:hypothetical protein [Planctomycetota bacterium]